MVDAKLLLEYKHQLVKCGYDQDAKVDHDNHENEADTEVAHHAIPIRVLQVSQDEPTVVEHDVGEQDHAVLVDKFKPVRKSVSVWHHRVNVAQVEHLDQDEEEDLQIVHRVATILNHG